MRLGERGSPVSPEWQFVKGECEDLGDTEAEFIRLVIS